MCLQNLFLFKPWCSNPGHVQVILYRLYQTFSVRGWKYHFFLLGIEIVLTYWDFRPSKYNIVGVESCDRLDIECNLIGFHTWVGITENWRFSWMKFDWIIYYLKYPIPSLASFSALAKTFLERDCLFISSFCNFNLARIVSP